MFKIMCLEWNICTSRGCCQFYLQFLVEIKGKMKALVCDCLGY